MEKKTRILTVGESVKYNPKVVLTGEWLRNSGFATGDQISVTSPEPGTLVIKMETEAALVYNAKRIKRAQVQLAAAEAQLKYCESFPAANP